MFGEIDCREGLLLAVDKLKYESMADAVSVLVDIYVDVLEGLIVDRHMEVFVHPVPPVLNETRHVVEPFNAALQEKVRRLSAEYADNNNLQFCCCISENPVVLLVEIFMVGIWPGFQQQQSRYPASNTYANFEKSQVTHAAEKPSTKGRLHWLDLYGNLVTPDRQKFNPLLTLDGTHMSPVFISFLEEALETIE